MKRPGNQKTIYAPEYKRLAKQLKRARLDAGLTQVQAAKNLGRPQSYISKVESNQYYLDVFELREFARIYKKSVPHFLKV